MPSIFNGTLTGSGIVHLSDTGVLPTDFDYWVETIGSQVDQRGVAGHMLLKRAGYIQFLFHPSQNFDPSQPDEAVTDALWFNYESADAPIVTTTGDQVTDFVFWCNGNTVVRINISA